MVVAGCKRFTKMKITVHLDQKDLESAVCHFLLSRGYKAVPRITFDRDGYPDSPDLRETELSFSATAEVETETSARPAWD